MKLLLELVSHLDGIYMVPPSDVFMAPSRPPSRTGAIRIHVPCVSNPLSAETLHKRKQKKVGRPLRTHTIDDGSVCRTNNVNVYFSVMSYLRFHPLLLRNQAQLQYCYGVILSAAVFCHWHIFNVTTLLTDG